MLTDPQRHCLQLVLLIKLLVQYHNSIHQWAYLVYQAILQPHESPWKSSTCMLMIPHSSIWLNWIEKCLGCYSSIYSTLKTSHITIAMEGLACRTQMVILVCSCSIWEVPWVPNTALNLLFNLEAARQGRSMLFSGEQKLLVEGWKKGFVKSTKLDFMRR